MSKNKALFLKQRKITKQLQKAVQVLPAMNSDGWANFITGLGIPGRDKAAGGGYLGCYNWNAREYDGVYRGDGLTKRIIDVVATEMVRQGWQIDGNVDGSVNEYIDKLYGVVALTDLIRWARLYGGAIMIMGIADGRPLDEPVNESDIRNIRWLRVYDRYQASPNIGALCYDMNDVNYGYPDIYLVNDYTTGQTFTVHHSRVLRMDWSLLPPRDRMNNQGWGESAITSIWQDIRNYGTTFANMANIVQDFVNTVLKIPGLSIALTNKCAESGIINRINYANMMKSVNNMTVIDAQESIEKLSTNVTGLSEILDRFMLSVCSVTGIPATILFGRSPAGFNSSGDSEIRNYYDMIKNYQENKLKPCLEKLVRYIFLAKDGPTNGIEPNNWNINFVPLWQNTEEQEANIRRTVAETDAIYIDRGVLDPIEVAESRFGGDKWSMNTEIDIEARKNGYNAEEIAQLQYEKEKNNEIDVTVGPDSLSSGENFIVVN